MANKEIKAFVHGVENLVSDEIIHADASSDSLNWFNQDGKLILIPGKVVVGTPGVAGKITGEIFGYKVDGSQIHWRKSGTKIQYFDGSDWIDTITGLTETADYSFTNYSSLSGSFTFAIGIDGIYKMHNACPQSYISLYDSTKNFKGHAFISTGRMILWDKPNDKTALYGSHIDPQTYTTITGEGTTSLTGTLAFKAGGVTRNCSAVTITHTVSGEVFTDNFLGVLTGSLGNSGTINYITGDYTFNIAGVGTAVYQWEDSNTNGVTDFTKSATRLAGEGFVFRQDEGGDPIINVVIASDGFYSLKQNSAYRLTIDSTDLIATNKVYRKQMGTDSFRGSFATSTGIIFINTQNPEKPEMTILEPNIASESLVPKILFPEFKFANYIFDDCTIDAYERYILVACKTIGSTYNNILLLCDLSAKTVNITNYSARTFSASAGLLYMGSSVTASIYQLFSGYDDDGFALENYWIGKGETWETINLKKHRHLRIKGSISISQSYGVYISYDDSDFQLVGTVLGTGGYVDSTSLQTIGSSYIGGVQIGGDALSDIYNYFIEIRLKKVPKFRKRKLKFIALGIGYASINYQSDNEIDIYEMKLPSRFREKQNVSKDGTLNNQDNPEF